MLGGSQGLSYLISIIRTKALAYLIGPSGIGLIGLYSSITATVGVLSGMGIGESAVRTVAVAHGSGDPAKLSRVATVIRRASLISGLMGLVLCMACAIPLSLHTFGDRGHVAAIAILGATLLMGAVGRGQTALIQGTGRVTLVAKMTVVGAVAGILPVILIYAWWKIDGVIPALLLTSLLSLLVSRYFYRSIPLVACEINWRETLRECKPILTLGLAFMFTGLLWTGKDLIVRAMITRTYGLDSVGIYQAAWAVSGLFVNFVLGAMGTDFYPRLTTLLDNHPAMVKAINQQIEIGVLLALPGVIATISCAPMVILLLYSPKFHGASELLAVLACGVFFKVVSYPLNLVQLAKGDARGFTIFGAGFALFESGMTIALLIQYGMMGAALAYPVSCLTHVLAMTWVGRKAIDHRFNPETIRLILVSLFLISAGSVIAYLLHGAAALGSGMLLSLLTSIYCLRSLSKRLGSEHRFIQMVLKLPGGKWMIS